MKYIEYKSNDGHRICFGTTVWIVGISSKNIFFPIFTQGYCINHAKGDINFYKNWDLCNNECLRLNNMLKNSSFLF